MDSLKSTSVNNSEWINECQTRLRTIYTTKNKVNIIPWDEDYAFDIDKIFTELSWLKDHRKPSGVTQTKLTDYTEIFNSGKRLLVYGRPGVGKTVFTKKAAFDWSQQRFQGTTAEAFDLALLIKLSDVSNLHDVPSILKASQPLVNDSQISVGDVYDYVLHHQERVLLILDGYDEYSAGKPSPIDEIWKRNRLRECCVIVTSRLMTTDKLRSPSDAQFEIKGFDDKRQKEFARRFLEDEEDVQKFHTFLREQHLEELAEIPLLLLNLCLLWMDKELLTKNRAEVFTQFIQTLFNHMRGKQSPASMFIRRDYSNELCELGRVAFEALMNDCIYFPKSELAAYDLIERLSEVGLFQVLNLAGLKPERGVYFIHKSVQEYLAAKSLKEELVSEEFESTPFLSKLNSVEKILKMTEVLKFASELSEEASRKIMSYLMGMAPQNGLTEYGFDKETPSEEDLSQEQKNFLTLCTQLLFYRPAEARRDLFPTFLSSLGGVLLINPDQLNAIVNEQLVKASEVPRYVFFANCNYEEQDYKNLVILSEQLNAVVVTCSGEKKASEFLSNSPWRRTDEFFLKKENITHLYLAKLVKAEYSGIPFLARDMIKALIRLESTKKLNINPEESTEDSNCSSKYHALSRVRKIETLGVDGSEVEQLSELMPFVTAPQTIGVWGEPGEVYDAEVTESLLRKIPLTRKLERLALDAINLTPATTASFIFSLFQECLNLESLDMSENPLLGAGVSSLASYLSCAPRLGELLLYDVKMTQQQVHELSTAVKQNSITRLESSYHDDEGNPKPEHQWPSEDYWKKSYPHVSIPESSTEIQNKQQQILAETRPSAHYSPSTGDNRKTVAPVPVSLYPAEAPIRKARRLASFSQYSRLPVYTPYYSSPHIHRATSTIVTPTPGGSSSHNRYLASCSGFSAVTQDETKVERLSVDEIQTRANTHYSPSTGDDRKTVAPVPVPLYPAEEAPIREARRLASFSQYPRLPVYTPYYSSPHIHRPTSTIVTPTPGRPLSSNRYLASCSGFSAVTQDETKVERLSVDERFNLPSTSFKAHDEPGPLQVRFATPTHRAHGFSHGLSPFSQYPHRPVYPQYYSSPHIHRATSTIFTPGGSLGNNVASCSGLSAVTQDETKLERLSVDESLNLPSTSSKVQDEPGSLQLQGDADPPRKGKKRKKHKTYRMTEGVEGASPKKHKRKKHKTHRRDEGGEKSPRKREKRQQHKAHQVTHGNKESPQREMKAKKCEAHQVTEGDEEPLQKKIKTE